MARFYISWSKTSRNEAGYANNPADAGKETYRGIASAFFPNWEGWAIVRKAIADLGLTGKTLGADKSFMAIWKQIDAALANNKDLDRMVQSFYKKEFWDKLNLDNEPNQLIADTAFDAAVNKGSGREKKWLNESREEANEIV